MKDGQPDFLFSDDPVSQPDAAPSPPEVIEYTPDEDSPPWMVMDWPGLADAFGLADAGALLPWHAALAGQGRPWLVIRRIYRVAPMWGSGSTPDDALHWDFKSLSESLGVSDKALRQDMADAAEFWRKVSTSQATARPVSGESSDPSVNPLDERIPDFSFSVELTPDEIDRLLTQMRFRVRSVADRAYVARRIVELKELLRDPNKRESARQLIIMERNLAAYEDSAMALRDRQEAVQTKIDHLGGDVKKEDAKEINDIASSLASIEKSHSALQVKYFEAADSLGAESREEGTVRKAAIGTISHLTEAHRLYYKEGDRTLVDGIFAADEVVWLLTPHEMRPAQYRADIAIRAHEALQPDNLWGPNHQPTKISREASRRLAAIVRAVAEETPAASETIPGVDDVTPGTADDDPDAEDDAPPPDATPSPETEPNATPPAPFAPDADDDDDCMAVE